MKTKPQPAWTSGHGRLAVALFGSLALHGLLAVALCLGPGPKPKKTLALEPELSYCGLESAEESEPPGYGAEGIIDPGPIDKAELRPSLDPLSQPLEKGGQGTTPAKGPEATPDGSGKAQGFTTKFFQAETTARKIVYVLDCSASMGQQGAWQAASRELLASLQQLAPPACFQVIVYNRFATFLLPHRPDWLTAEPETLAAVAKALGSLQAEGTTEHGPALRKALSLKPEVMYFLTDADDLTAEHLRLAAACNRHQAIIHTIELNTRNRQRHDMPLQILARENRGIYCAVDLRTHLPAP